jgi:hypothetical protein
MTSIYKVFVDKLGGTSSDEYIGKSGDLFYDPIVKQLKVSNGVTEGGEPITITRDNADIITSPTVNQIVTLTQSEYDSIAEPDEKTLYIVTGA